MEKLVVGLCKGRHEMPVEEYIFPAELDPTDIDGINVTAWEWVVSRCEVENIVRDPAINQGDDESCHLWQGWKDLVIYVTGLTVALTAVIRACARNGVHLTLMHFDRETGNYLPQRMW